MMTPWAYTDDNSVPFNVARFFLSENDQATARLTDATITTTLATFGWQSGMAVLAQGLIVDIGQEVIRSAEQGGPTYEFAKDRLDGLKSIKAQADRGVLPDPTTGPIDNRAQGTTFTANTPAW